MWLRKEPENEQPTHPDNDTFECTTSTVEGRICKTAFLAVWNGRLDPALKAQRMSNGTPHTDQRGRHEPGKKRALQLSRHTLKVFPNTCHIIHGLIIHIEST